jgi:SAM-dependent methyltransferase
MDVDPGDEAMTTDDLKEKVKQRYGSAVSAAVSGEGGGCCGPGLSCGPASTKDPITRNIYADDETDGLPEDAVLASFGCGNPTALADLRPGEIVLDLGSGGGIDVLLSAKRVAPGGKAYGLDMTPEMLSLARANQAKAGIANAEFLEGTIESIPLPDSSVDVIVSNCVINLSGDKQRVFEEAFRVLRPGGRFAVSDVVMRRELPESVRGSMELWTGCVAGALLEKDYVRGLERAGFVDVTVEPTRVFERGDVEEMACGSGCEDGGATAEALDGAVMSAFIRARKP